MSLAPGARIGQYEVVAPLGAGGMGEVYRARDTKLGRDVAIKLLPSHLADDPDRLSRLAREARLLASLNHPNIATIHGLEESGGLRALVMELVEGPTLAEKPGLTVPDSLKIAGQIAEGLAAAHDKGIVHRDLKPANIKLSRDGSVRVLDFGLAKASASHPHDGGESQLPTISSTDMQPGAIVGTPAYMSPEQARGLAIDKRTDIWAFGCVLYEMLAARRAFPGKTITDTVAAILERDPDWSALPADTPASVRRLLRRCLEKDANRRLHDIADARIEIDDARSGASADREVVAAARPARLAWIVALLAASLAVGGAAAWVLRPVPAASEVRLEINTPPTRDDSIAISPDGRTIAFVVGGAGPQLWLRSLDALTARPLAGTERATHPFWSPDGRAIGFFAGTRLMWMEIDGGAGHTLSTVSAVPLGGTWNRDGVILFADNPGGGISRVNAKGGEPVAATQVELPRTRGHESPRFLPDGRHFLYYATGSAEGRGIYVGELDSLAGKRLFAADSPAEYAPSGHLLFIRDGKLLAQRFDTASLTVRGDALPIQEHLAGSTTFAASAGGPIAWRSAAPDSGQRQLVWFDRTGRVLDKEVYANSSAQGPAMSSDGQRIALFRFADDNMDLWSFDTRRRTWERLSSHRGDEIYPLWSRDGRSMIYGAVRTAGSVLIFRRVLDAPPDDEELLVGEPGGFPTDWSGDGRFLVYSTARAATGSDIVALEVGRKGARPFDVVKTEFSEGLAQFSPDGKWIAYESDQTGRTEVYLRPFPGPGAAVVVSTNGGSQARWNPAGGELFYVADDNNFMAVPFVVTAGGQGIEPGKPAVLFATNVGKAVLKYRQQYMVFPDGKSFVMNSSVGDAGASPISIILNWKPRN